MKYEEFERILLDEDVPYAFIKIAWEAKPWAGEPFNEINLREVGKKMVRWLPKEALDALREISSQEIEPGALESIGRRLRD